MKTKSSFTRIFASSPVNLVINNFFWAGCVVGRYELLWLVAPAVIVYALFLIANSRIQTVQLLWPLSIGILIDSFFTAIGLFQFPEGNQFLPLWMCVLWLAFATTLPLSLKPLGRNGFMAAVTGAIGFPFSYLLGSQIGAVSFGLPVGWTVLVLVVTWAVTLPFMFRLIDPKENISSEMA